MKESDPQKINRQIPQLVDGTLGENAEIELLNLIETSYPEAWRTLALAHIEARVIKSAFAEEAAEDSTGPENTHRSANHFKTVFIAAAAALGIGLFAGHFISPKAQQPNFTEAAGTPAGSGTAPAAGSSHFQTIESLKTAFQNRGLHPAVSNAVYQTELPDGRRLYLPIQTLSLTQ